jgi:aminotransferase
MKKVLKEIVSEREKELKELTIGEMLKLAVEDPKIISLGPGEPDYNPPKHIINAACDALKKGYTHYSPVDGRKELREAIAKKLKKENKININPDQIIVTCGSNEAILLSLMASIDPGEQVLVPDPGFLSYIPTVEVLNGQALSIPTRPQEDFQILPESVNHLLRNPKKVRAIIINSPNNPTGAVYTKKTLEQIADIAVEHDLMIISDEAYEKLVYKGKHISIGSLNGMDKYTLTLHSFSKSYGMAGFRLGYAAGPEKVIKAMTKLNILTTLCAPTMSQIAGVAALKGPQTDIKKHLKEYAKRRDFVIKRLKEISCFESCEPEGAFYAFPKIKTKMSSLKFSYWLLKNAKVVTIPGTEFGRYGEGFVRISYATELSLIKKAMNRIEKAVKKLK